MPKTPQPLPLLWPLTVRLARRLLRNSSLFPVLTQRRRYLLASCVQLNTRHPARESLAVKPELQVWRPVPRRCCRPCWMASLLRLWLWWLGLHPPSLASWKPLQM